MPSEMAGVAMTTSTHVIGREQLSYFRSRLDDEHVAVLARSR